MCVRFCVYKRIDLCYHYLTTTYWENKMKQPEYMTNVKEMTNEEIRVEIAAAIIWDLQNENYTFDRLEELTDELDARLVQYLSAC